ncbi:MAG: type IV pilus assembly protein PilM [Deltaproteobacteria bacterium]|nr:MAG: type IV pilus assembly protein PilM [Deltaproteobacteria bacterium]
MLFSRSKGVIGLDIGSSSIKVLELKEAKGGYTLQNIGIQPLPPEAIVDAALMNSPVVVDVIRELISRLKIKTKDVVTSVSGHSVIIRKITLPLMTEEEVEGNIQWEAEQYIPFDINDVNIDFQILQPDTHDQENLDVLLVAVKKDLIDDYTSVIMEAGLNPVIVDVDAFAVENMYGLNYPSAVGKVLALVNIGASIININILKDGTSTFTRDISIGGNQITEEIQKQLNVSFEVAEAIKIGEITEGYDPAEIREIINSVSASIALEIQRSLDFFTSTSMTGHISKVYASGGCAKTPGLTKVIEDQLGIPVEIVNPFNNIEINPKIFDTAYIEEIAPLCGVAVGLAWRRPGDK